MAITADAARHAAARRAHPPGSGDQLRQGLPLELVDALILASPEGFAEQGGSDEDFVDALYGDFLDRVPSNDEITFWANRIASKGDDYGARFAVTLEIALSQEAREDTADTLYGYWLDRSADPGGRAYWAGEIGRRGILGVEADFVAQDEVYEHLSS